MGRCRRVILNAMVMIQEINSTTRIIDLTVGQLQELVITMIVPQTTTIQQSKYVYGIAGLQSILGCKRSKAQEVKNSGVIDNAIIQFGKTIIVDAEKALELLKNQNTIKL